MTQTETPLQPTIPFPVSRISKKIERYMLYDINAISWLRKTQNILGVLIGTLPQIPQQNVFLGLPLELQPEEARLLAEKGLAFLVDDLDWHTADLASKTNSQVEAIKADVHKKGTEIARRTQQIRQKQGQKALEKQRAKQESNEENHSAIEPLENELDDTEETLFGVATATDNEVTTSSTPREPSVSNLNPWTFTSVSSYPAPTTPQEHQCLDLPKVNPASYALFAHLHSKGYFISPGIRFGCQFSVYPGDPLRFHSHFLSMSYQWDEELELLDLIGGGRLGTGVKKGWLIGGPVPKDDGPKEEGNQEEVRTFCVEWGGM